MDVRMPDGTIITNVPEGVTRADLAARLSRAQASPPPSAGAPSSMDMETTGKSLAEFASSRDPGIDYATGVQDFGFRTAFSNMTNEAEKTNFLNRSVGQGNWSKDSFGAYFLKPEGLAKLGIQSKTPVSLDEQTMSRYDVADVLGDLPALAGGIGMGMAATGLGAPKGIALSALGAAGGRAIQEITKNLMGNQVNTPEGVAGELAKEGALAATGEGVTRALKPLGRFAMGPGASKMTPEKKALMDTALEQGFRPRPGQVTDAPILARWEGMVKRIFGDLNQEQNDAAANAALSKLVPGQKVSVAEAGEAVREAIINGRRALSKEAGERYGQVDQLAEGPFVPTAALKNVAIDIMDSLPKTTDGKPVFSSARTVELLNDIQSLPQRMTAREMQQVRTTLREASALTNLTPDLSKAHARMLREAADRTFDDAASMGNTRAVAALRAADAWYKEGISKFDNKLAAAIARDPGKVGSLEPELVVDAIVKPGQGQRIARIKSAVSPEAWQKVQSAHAEELTSAIVKQTDDPLKQVFDGKAFKEALDKYSPQTLTAVHGAEWTANAYKFANSLMLVQKEMKASGGIVAANIALHPLVNLPKLVWLRGVAKLMQQPGTLNYLTEGIKAPNTRAGMEALTRVATQAALIANDETGSASFTVTDPKRPPQDSVSDPRAVSSTYGVRG